jgi:hypothetical protein
MEKQLSTEFKTFYPVPISILVGAPLILNPRECGVFSKTSDIGKQSTGARRQEKRELICARPSH